MPKVSIIVPNYNHASFLNRRLDSIFQQTYADYDLLILDDKSPDDSISVIEPYLADPRVSFVANEVNSGSPYRQWQKGLGLTSGEYVWIAESDDYADPAFLEFLVAALDGHPSAGIAMSMSNEIDGDGRFLGRFFDQWDKSRYSEYGRNPFLDEMFFMNGREFAGRYMVPWNTIPNASGALFRRAAFDAIGGPVANMKICGDWFTYCKMLMQYDFVSVNKDLNFFRIHTTNVRLRTKATDFVREAREIRAYVARSLDQKPSSHLLRMENDFYAQMLLGPERRGPEFKVPLSRYGAVIASAAQFGPALATCALGGLAREALGRIQRRLRPRNAVDRQRIAGQERGQG